MRNSPSTERVSRLGHLASCRAHHLMKLLCGTSCCGINITLFVRLDCFDHSYHVKRTSPCGRGILLNRAPQIHLLLLHTIPVEVKVYCSDLCFGGRMDCAIRYSSVIPRSLRISPVPLTVVKKCGEEKLPFALLNYVSRSDLTIS
eukprot:scaffold543_cov106-Skeletonema_marinoi.AAC.4